LVTYEAMHVPPQGLPISGEEDTGTCTSCVCDLMKLQDAYFYNAARYTDQHCADTVHRPENLVLHG